MAINISVSRTFPGFGVSTLTSIQVATGIAVTSGTAYYIPGTSSNSVAGLLVPTITAGRVRIKIYNGAGTTPTVLSVLTQAYDGTNLVTLDQFYVPTSSPTPPTLSTTAWFDRMFDFVCDTAPSTTSGGAVGYLIGGASATSGNGGAQCIKVTPTLGGTSPAATMDVELFGLI